MWKTKVPYYFIDQQNNFIDFNDNVIGVERISSGGGSGVWINIDRYGNRIIIPENYFDKHTTYASFKKISYTNINSKTDEFIKVPKFYFKTEGNRKYWISPTKEEGFQVYPAFIKESKEIEYFLIGKYTAKVISNTKGYDVIYSCNTNEVPSCNYSFKEFSSMIDYKNSISDSKGYHLINIYELGALQLLGLIEACTTDFQSFFGMGCCGLGNTKNEFYKKDLMEYNMVNLNSVYDSSKNNYNSDFHGIIGLWGNTWEIVDGVKVVPSTNVDRDGMEYIGEYTLRIFNNTGVISYLLSDTDIEKTPELTYIDTGIVMHGYNIEVGNPLTEGYSYGTYNDILSGEGVSFGETKGEYRTVTYNLNEVFLPDFRTINSERVYSEKQDTNHELKEEYQKTGTYSDYAYKNKEDKLKPIYQVVAYGGTFEMKDKVGIFAYKFNIEETEKRDNISTRLCRYPVDE